MGLKQEGDNQGRKVEKPSGFTEVKWGFIKEELPDFMNDSMEKIQNWVEGFTFLPEDVRNNFVERIRTIRGVDDPKK